MGLLNEECHLPSICSRNYDSLSTSLTAVHVRSCLSDFSRAMVSHISRCTAFILPLFPDLLSGGPGVYFSTPHRSHVMICQYRIYHTLVGCIVSCTPDYYQSPKC